MYLNIQLTGYFLQYLLYKTCLSDSLTLFKPGFLAGVVRGGGFQLHPLTPLSLKLDDSNFVPNYFGAGSIFWCKKNRDQIKNDVTITSSLL